MFIPWQCSLHCYTDSQQILSYPVSLQVGYRHQGRPYESPAQTRPPRGCWYWSCGWVFWTSLLLYSKIYKITTFLIQVTIIIKTSFLYKMKVKANTYLLDPRSKIIRLDPRWMNTICNYRTTAIVLKQNCQNSSL